MSRRKFVVIAMLLTVYALGCVALALLLPAMRPATSDPGQLSGQTRLPDMLAISDIPTRKQIFIDTLLPLILQKTTCCRHSAGNFCNGSNKSRRENPYRTGRQHSLNVCRRATTSTATKACQNVSKPY